MKAFGITIAVLITIFGMTWLIEGNDFFLYQYFAPKRAAVERKVFTNTPSYIYGTVQELQNMQAEYAVADKDGKASLKPIILHRAAGIDESSLPADLNQFIQQLKEQQ